MHGARGTEKVKGGEHAEREKSRYDGKAGGGAKCRGQSPFQSKPSRANGTAASINQSTAQTRPYLPPLRPLARAPRR